MVQQYKEELSCKSASNDVPLYFNASFARKFLKSEEVDCQKMASSSNEDDHVGTKKLKNKRHVCWHNSVIDSTSSIMKEKIGSCTLLRSNTNGLEDFQDLDHRAIEVLRRSQQVIEGGQACKSIHHIDYIEVPSYIFNNGHSLPYNSKTTEISSHKNHCRTRDVVARNFEEIDQILGESNLVIEPSSCNDIQHKDLDYTKVRKEIRQIFRELEFEPGKSLYGASAEHSKQDKEVKEEAATKAANCDLNENNGHSNIQSTRLFKNPIVHRGEKLTSISRLSSNVDEDSLHIVNQAYYPSIFNTNKQHEWQSKMVLPYSTMEYCQEMKICNQSMPTTSLETPIIHSMNKWQENAEGDMQLLNNSIQLDSGNVDFAFIEENKGTWKYVEEINFSKGHLGSTKPLKLDGGLPTSNKSSATTTGRHRLSTMDLEKYPFSIDKNLMNKSLKFKDICSIQIPVNQTTCFRQELGDHEIDVPVSNSQRCIRGLIKGTSHKPLRLEDDIRQLSTKDLFLALENLRKTRASLKSLSAKNRFEASYEGQRTYQPEKYLSHGKCSTSLTTSKFISSFADGLDRKDEELITYSTIQASFEQNYKGVFQSKPNGYLLKSNPIQKNNVCNFDPAGQLLCTNAKLKGTKDKDIKSPTWMHGLNVKKPKKWHAMSIIHPRLQDSTANLIKKTVVVGELKELALQHNKPKDTILVAAVDGNFKGRALVDFDCKGPTTSISNKDSVINCNRKIGDHIPTPVHRKIIETRKADEKQTTHVFSTHERKWFENRDAHITSTTKLSEKTGIQVEPSFAHCSDSYLNQWIHKSEDLADGISYPRVLKVQKNHCITNNMIAQEDTHFKNMPRNTTFSSGLDFLIYEIVHEWLEICSTSSYTFLTCDGSQDLPTMSHHSTCSITAEVNTNCLVLEDKSSSPEIKLEDLNKMQVSEAKKWPKYQDHLRKEKGSISLPRDSNLMKDVRKTSIAALTSVVQSLLAALQEAQIEESIVIEFEADETIRLLVEKLQFYETKIRALMNRQKIQNPSHTSN